MQRAVPACASCHGEKAEGTSGFPRLAGQHADDVLRQPRAVAACVQSL